jgi:hypothetical protein
MWVNGRLIKAEQAFKILLVTSRKKKPRTSFEETSGWIKEARIGQEA